MIVVSSAQYCAPFPPASDPISVRVETNRGQYFVGLQGGGVAGMGPASVALRAWLAADVDPPNAISPYDPPDTVGGGE